MVDDSGGYIVMIDRWYGNRPQSCESLWAELGLPADVDDPIPLRNVVLAVYSATGALLHALTFDDFFPNWRRQALYWNTLRAPVLRSTQCAAPAQRGQRKPAGEPAWSSQRR